MDASIPVSIVVLNFNGRAFLKACFDSIFAQDYPAFEVILVDNASSDGSAEFIEQNYPSTRVLRSRTNLGFAGGNNVGVEAATHDMVVLVNNDVVVESGWLSELLAAIQEPNVGIASSLVKTVGIPELFYQRNGTLNLLGQNIMLAFEDPADIFFPTGCSCIFRKSEFGLPFDPDYFAYAEDCYLGFRARFAGRRVMHTNGSRLFHFGGGTSGKQRSAFIAFFQERNRLLNLLLFFGLSTRFRLSPYIAANIFAKTIHGLIRTRGSLPGVWKAYAWLLTHPRVIARKRLALMPQKRVPDGEVLRYMSCRLLDSESSVAHFINGCSALYCRLVGIRTLENLPRSAILCELRNQMGKTSTTVKEHP